jgi:hypothetical protein
MIFKQRIHVATLIQTQILYSIQKPIAIATLNSTSTQPFDCRKASIAIATLKSTIPLQKASNEEQTNTAIITIDILII